MWGELTSRVRQEHLRFEREVREWNAEYARGGGRLHCRKGCGGCCNLAVNATFAEAVVAAEGLSEPQLASVREHVARLREHLRRPSDLKAYLKMQRRDVGFCPFLEEGASCGIYDRRPLSCRSLLSTRPEAWCAVDFGELSRLERRLFMDSLDRAVVAFPTHYVAATQDLGREMESSVASAMLDRFGVSVTGYFPYLVFLEAEHGLSAVMPHGFEATEALLERQDLLLPFVVSLDG